MGSGNNAGKPKRFNFNGWMKFIHGTEAVAWTAQYITMFGVREYAGSKPVEILAGQYTIQALPTVDRNAVRIHICRGHRGGIKCLADFLVHNTLIEVADQAVNSLAVAAKELEALRSQLAEARGVLDEINEQQQVVMAEECPSDEHHCTCVPLLRTVGKRLEAQLAVTREGLVKIRDAETEVCGRCEGSGRLWADGKAHSPNYTGPTKPCPGCHGNGCLPLESSVDIAATALAETGEQHE